jgi:hypothetical protein
LATDPLDIWLDEFEKIPQDPTGDLAPKNLADFVDQRVTRKLETSSQVVQWTPAPTFTWQKATFESTLRILCKIPSVLPLTPAIQMATAWKTATLISTFMIQPQAKMNPPAPATTGIAATAGAVIDPASVELAYVYLVAQLGSVVPVSNQKGAVFPRAFRQAFLMVTYTISGIDTTPPPAGPIPFMYPMTPVQ